MTAALGTACALVAGLDDKSLDPGIVEADAATVTDAAGGGADASAAPDASSAVVFADGQAKPWGVAVDEAFVYWTNEGDGTVARRARTGGAIAVLAKDQAEPQQILVDTTNIVWHNANLGNRLAADGGGEVLQIARLPKTTTGMDVPTRIESDRGTSQIRRMAFSPFPDNQLWTTWKDRVRRNRRDNDQDGIQVVGNLDGKEPTMIAADETSVYWFLQQPLEVWRAGKRFEQGGADAGEDPVKMATLNVPVDVTDMVADGKALFLVTKGGAVLKLDAPIATLPKQIHAGTPMPRAMIADATSLYLTRSSADDAPGTGEVVAIPKTGGAETVLAAGLSRPRQLALHAGPDGRKTLFVAANGDGTIRAVPVP